MSLFAHHTPYHTQLLEPPTINLTAVLFRCYVLVGWLSLKFPLSFVLMVANDRYAALRKQAPETGEQTARIIDYVPKARSPERLPTASFPFATYLSV